jgi:hypothetical protein
MKALLLGWTTFHFISVVLTAVGYFAWSGLGHSGRIACRSGVVHYEAVENWAFASGDQKGLSDRGDHRRVYVGPLCSPRLLEDVDVQPNKTSQAAAVFAMRLILSQVPAAPELFRWALGI